jgi:hypothetical protein
MNESELHEIVRHLEAAVAVYAKHEGKLTAVELSLKSLTSTLHAQTQTQLRIKRDSWL